MGPPERKHKAKQSELEEVNQNSKKKQTRLYEIKTNEEYTSDPGGNGSSSKAKSYKLETEILEQMEQGNLTAEAG